MKIHYEIQYINSDYTEWGVWNRFQDYETSLKHLQLLRKEYQESKRAYPKSHIFRLVKVQTVEEILN